MSDLPINSDAPYAVRMAKVLGAPVRIQILLEAGQRDLSPSQFCERFPEYGSVSALDHHFKVLTEFGWLLKAGQKTGGRRRGAKEQFYRASQPMIFDNNTWAQLPESVQSSITCQAFTTFMDRVWEATTAETIDRDDSHVSWLPATVDQIGWDNIVKGVDELFGFILEEQKRAKTRLEETDSKAIPMTIGLAAFESPARDEPEES